MNPNSLPISRICVLFGCCLGLLLSSVNRAGADDVTGGTTRLAQSSAATLTSPAAKPETQKRHRSAGRQSGAPRVFDVDPGWDEDRFPSYAMCYQSPETIAATYAKVSELIESLKLPGDRSGYPSSELDRVFREIAWKAVISDPLTRVKDADGNGIAD